MGGVGGWVGRWVGGGMGLPIVAPYFCGLIGVALFAGRKETSHLALTSDHLQPLTPFLSRQQSISQFGTGNVDYSYADPWCVLFEEQPGCKLEGFSQQQQDCQSATSDAPNHPQHR